MRRVFSPVRITWVPIAIAALVIVGLFLDYAGIHWLVGLGGQPDQSFNPDDERFIRAAHDFINARQYLNGYLYFMTAQLVAITTLLRKILHEVPNYLVVLRSISIVYAQLAIILTYLLARRLGQARWTAMLAAFLLVVAPLQVVMASQGTPDAVIVSVFYAGILAAMQARTTGKPVWFYACCALAGLALGAKFFLPALVPPVLLILAAGRARAVERVFLAGCIGLAAFYAAGMFCFTVWDFKLLVYMLRFDNMVVAGGVPPPVQIVAYAWDSITAAGLPTACLAAAGLAMAASRTIRHTRPALREATGSIAGLIALVTSPRMILALALLAHVFMIVSAQVHFMRHLLVLVPIQCIFAAAACAKLAELAQRRGRAGIAVATALLGVLAAEGLLNAWLSAERFREDPRVAIIGNLRAEHAVETSTFGDVGHVLGVHAVGGGIATTPRFVACNVEYDETLRVTDVAKVFHPDGGKARFDFFRALFAGRTDYREVARFRLPARSLEDRLARVGLLRPLDTFVARECIVFRRRSHVA